MQHLIHVLFKSVSYTDSSSLCWWVVWFTLFWKMCHGVCHSGALVVGWLLIHKCHDTVIVLNVCCIICQPGTLCCGKVTDSQMLMCFENVFTVVYTVQVLCLVCAVFLIVVTMPSFRCCRLWWDIWFTSVCSFIQVLSVVVRHLIHQPVLFHSCAVGCGETSDSPACALSFRCCRLWWDVWFTSMCCTTGKPPVSPSSSSSRPGKPSDRTLQSLYLWVCNMCCPLFVPQLVWLFCVAPTCPSGASALQQQTWGCFW